MSKKVLISVGPIPAKLDSVKFLTNRFKGGLALKTAQYLKSCGHNVQIVAWKYTELDTNIPVIRIEDVVDYYNKIISIQADCYILAAAVANLMPSNPYEGKFPSHNYKVGEKFNIEFEIAPRVIDEIKMKYLKCALIGYKLYDGSDEELIKAGKKTLFDSKANIVFANHPKWAKDKKIVLTQDGSVFECSFDEHLKLINKLINSQYFESNIIQNEFVLNEQDNYIFNTYPKYNQDERVYGCVAIRKNTGFITTTRGKKEDGIAHVLNCDFQKKMIVGNKKATLNAPLLAKLFELNPSINILLHGHELKGKSKHDEYEFVGTTNELKFAQKIISGQEILLKHHGYIVGFKNVQEYTDYLNKNYVLNKYIKE